MTEILRFLTTTVIWLAYAGTVLASLLSGTRVEDWVIALIVVVFGLLAAYATRKVWPFTVVQTGETLASQGVQRSAKAKRDRLERVARLMEGLDEDDMVELETLLAVQDQESGL